MLPIEGNPSVQSEVVPAAISVFGEEGPVALAIVGAFGLVGLFLCYVGVTNLRRAYSIWTNEPIDAGSLHLESGVVEVQGEVEPIDDVGTLASEYTGTECVAYSYRRKEKRRTHSSTDDSGSNTEWKTVESGEQHCPFYVTDGTGAVAVDPVEATLSLDSERVGTSSIRTRKYEGLLKPGDTVHVFGQKLDASDGGAPADERSYVGAGDRAPAFTVSDTTEGWTVLRFTAKGLGLLVFGVLVVAFLSVGVLGPTDPLGSITDLIPTAGVLAIS